MKKLASAIITVLSLGLMGVLMIVFNPSTRGQQRSDQMKSPAPGRMIKPERKGAEVPAPGFMRAMALEETDPIFPVEVDPTLTLDAPTHALYQQAAAQLSGYATVPQDRLDFYSAVTDPPAWRINGWTGYVEQVTPNNGGNLIKVRVMADLSSDDYGPVTIISTEYYETYQVTNGIIQYIGFDDPLGMSGLAPDGAIGL